MKVGMLWYDDNPTRSLVKKVALAAAHYRKTRGVVPDICLVHPSALDDGAVEVGVITVKSSPTVLRHHFWLGQEKKR